MFNWLSHNFVDIIDAIAWPIAIFAILFFYRAIFANLLYSANEYNFFGLKGNVKSVKDVVQDRVDEIRRKEREDNANEKQVQELIEQSQKSVEEKERLGEFVAKVWEENDNLKKENLLLKKRVEHLTSGPTKKELEEMINDLLRQTAALEKRIDIEDDSEQNDNTSR